MSGRIPAEFIKDLLVRVDIVDLIDSHVPLKKAGGSYVARCPFHTEKSPSFSVNQKKQFYHCFGCGEGGDAIRFLEHYNHLNFVEAVEDLASFAGIEVPREAASYSTTDNKQNLTEIYQVLEKAALFYIGQLRDSDEKNIAIDYLKARGVSGEIAKDFALGYAPRNHNKLLTNFSQKQLIAAGLLVSTDSGQSYDPFRGRLIFPIRDKRKRVIGFGGRVLDDSQPKYRNSPETLVFSKSQQVYGLSELLEKNSKPEKILVVEGYMDVIALAQFGIKYAVATLGTSTSKTHLELLFRFSPELIFCFDGDNAGRKAAWKAMEISFPSLSGRRQIKFMLLPQDQDPDTLIREKGQEGFEALIKNAQTLSEYFFDQLKYSLDLTTIEGKARLLNEGKGFLESMSDGFSKDMMRQSFEELVGPVNLEIKKNIAPRKKIKHTPLRVVIALLLQNPEYIEIVEQLEPDWSVLSFPANEMQGIELLWDIIQTIDDKQPQNAPVLRQLYQKSKWKDAVNMLANFVISPPGNIAFDEKKEFKLTMLHLIKQGEKQYFDKLIQKK